MQGRTSSPGWWLCCSVHAKDRLKKKQQRNSSSITCQQQIGSLSFSACGLLDVPQVSASVFVFMANHKIVAPDRKPGHLMQSFLFSCQTKKMTSRRVSDCVNENLLGCWDTSPQVCARGKTTLWEGGGREKCQLENKEAFSHHNVKLITNNRMVRWRQRPTVCLSKLHQGSYVDW